MTVITTTTGADHLSPNILALELEMLLNTKPFMRSLCVNKGNTRGTGSTVIKVGQLDDDDVAEAVAENVAITGDTNITDASYTLTPARQSIKRTLTDLMSGVSRDGFGLYSPVQLAKYNFGAIMRAFDALVAAALPSFNGTSGTTGLAFDYTGFLSGKQTLAERQADGRIIWLGHPEQWTDLEIDIRSELGVLQFDPANLEAMQVKGPTFKGFVNGVECHTSTQVTNAGGDHLGAMFLFGALAYGEGSPSPFAMAGNRVMAPGGVVYTDFDFAGDEANQIVWTNYFAAAGVADANKGIDSISIDD